MITDLSYIEERSARMREFMYKEQEMPKLIELPRLTPQEFAERRIAKKVPVKALCETLNITRARLHRIELGEEGSLVVDKETGKAYVPGFLVLALLCIENGFLIDWQDHEEAGIQ